MAKKKAAKKDGVRATVTARVYDDVHHRLDMLASKDRRPLQELIDEALKAYLEKRGA